MLAITISANINQIFSI